MALVPAWATTTMRRAGCSSFHSGGASETCSAPASSSIDRSPVTMRMWKSRKLSPPGRPFHSSSTDRRRSSAKICCTTSVGVPSQTGAPISASQGSVVGSMPSALDERRGGLLGPHERGDEQLVDLERGDVLGHGLGLAVPELGERRVVDREAVAVPLGLAVADEDDFHAGRA